MIIQCEECQTRFRLADEKLKPAGTKVRCSKCKHVFTVMPPAPEPAEQDVDFDAMNMEAVSGPQPAPDEPAADRPMTDEASGPKPTEAQPADTETETARTDDSLPVVDFSGLELQRPEKATERSELADEFSFAQPEAASEDDASRQEEEDGTEGPEPYAEPGGDISGFEDFAPEVGDIPPRPGNALDLPDDEDAAFTFEDPPEAGVATAGEATGDEFSFGDEEDADAFDFEDPLSAPAAGQDDLPESESFSLGVPEDAAADFSDETSTQSVSEEFGLGEGNEEFSFEDEPVGHWEDTETSTEAGFDFDVPAFESESDVTDTPEKSDGDLQFGEIDFVSDPGDESPAYETGEDFAEASFAAKESPDSFSQAAPPQREAQASKVSRKGALPTPPARRKGPLSRILFLLVFLLLILGGAAGYFYMQDGSLDLNRILERLTGKAQVQAPEHRIGITIEGSSYVNNPSAGQLLVIQGEAVNNYQNPRSAITVKGILLDAQGDILLQQTVAAGNFIDNQAISRMPFKEIEEAMNNQFGDSLSNMNVAAGKAIPFTIVFRNLPDSIASINVEVAGSKSGSS